MNEPDPRLVALGLVPPPVEAPQAPQAPPPRPPEKKVAAPRRAPGPLDRFLPPSAFPQEEPAPETRAPGPLDKFLTPSYTSPPPSTQHASLTQTSAPPPLPPLAAAMPSDAPITLSAGAIAAAKGATTTVDKRGAKAAEKAAATAAKEAAREAAKEAREGAKHAARTAKATARQVAKAPSLASMPRPAVPALAAAPAAVVIPRPVAIPAAPAFPASAVLLRGPVAVGLAQRTQQLTLEVLGLRIDTPIPIEVPWASVEYISARRGRVVIRSNKREVAFGVPVEGVVEPEIAGPLAAVIQEAKGGSLDLAGSAFLQLQNVTDSLRDRFTDEDDPVVPTIVGLVFVLSTAAIAAMLPEALVLSTRSAVTPGQFLIDSRLSSFDPRMLLSAVAGGAMITSGVVRVAMGKGSRLWARGTLRGWHTGVRFGMAGQMARKLLARVVLGPSIAAGVLLIAFIASLPSAREETVIDATGIHIHRELPFFDEDRSWRDVTEITTVPAPLNRHLEGVAVVIRFANKSPVTTLPYDLRGGTDKQLLARATVWRDAVQSDEAPSR